MRSSLLLLAGLSLAASACVRTPPPTKGADEAKAPKTTDAEAIAASAQAPAASASSDAPRALATLPLFEDKKEDEDFVPRGDAFELGFDGVALDELVHEAEVEHSDSLLVISRGKLIVERNFGKPRGPVETMSVTKSLASIAIGALVQEGKIQSIDAPLSTWFPEWADGEKANVTLRHVLTHTTGLDHLGSAQRWNAHRDRVAFARTLPLTEAPGATFSYSNEASALLAGVVAAAAGEPIDKYLSRVVFAPLGITDVRWAKDGAGTPQTFYGASLSARDLAKLGLLMLGNGKWLDQQILAPSFVAEATKPAAAPAETYGLMWWIKFEGVDHTESEEQLGLLASKGFSATDKLRPLLGKHYPTEGAYFLEAGARLDETERDSLAKLSTDGASPIVTKPGKPIGYAADGWLGQYLVVYPGDQLIAVRQHRAEGGGIDDNVKHGFRSFYDKLRATLPKHP